MKKRLQKLVRAVTKPSGQSLLLDVPGCNVNTNRP
jgi:hypothetical protein